MAVRAKQARANRFGGQTPMQPGRHRIASKTMIAKRMSKMIDHARRNHVIACHAIADPVRKIH